MDPWLFGTALWNLFNEVVRSTIAGFADHPEYIVDLHLQGEEALYPEDLEMRQHFEAVMNALVYVLMCFYCRSSYADFLASDPVEAVPRGGLPVWLWRMHERVNRKLERTTTIPAVRFLKRVATWPAFADPYMTCQLLVMLGLNFPKPGVDNYARKIQAYGVMMDSISKLLVPAPGPISGLGTAMACTFDPSRDCANGTAFRAFVQRCVDAWCLWTYGGDSAYRCQLKRFEEQFERCRNIADSESDVVASLELVEEEEEDEDEGNNRSQETRTRRRFEHKPSLPPVVPPDWRPHWG
ncbi:Erv1 / Alr motif [Mollivirus sibericum]|uniref:Erv1 / Alr motif n=1 Tax=Mollivirus sibericum TaxID=1678078 RepID=UPI0006B2DD29|nr:Erv1 / Alr motif [Mollivirus sibericum]ALD62236.1 Erv1 / Alr motif [Mollivirus sibericum]